VDQVRDLAREYFGGFPRGADVPDLPPFPERPRTDGERRKEVEDPLAQLPLLYMSYGTPPATSRDQAALSVLSRVFSAGQSSRLYKRLVSEEQAALTVISNVDRRLGPGMMLFGALPNQGYDVATLESLVDEEIQRLQDEGITERELQKAKNQLRWEAVQSRSTVQSKAQLLQQAQLYYASPFEANRGPEQLQAVTLEDVQRVARTYLTPSNRTVVIARPARPAGE
jgi:predicted Zn-dependent peptidase